MDANGGSNTNYTMAVGNLTLQELNDQRARRTYPVVAYMTVAMVIGIFGNFLVFCVYYTRFKRTPNNLLILLLSVFDLLAGVLVTPFEIVDMMYPYMHGDIMQIPCKLFRFLGTSLLSGSVMIIGCIAFERYKKISDPVNTLGTRKTRMLMIGSVVFVIIVSIPMAFIFGHRTEVIRIHGASINVSDCSVDDELTNTSVLGMYSAFMLFAFFICFAIYAYFYIRIALIIRRRQHTMTMGRRSEINRGFSDHGESTSLHSSISQISHTEISTADLRRDSLQLRVVSGVTVGTARLTLMFLVVSVVCVISFTPTLVLEVVNVFVRLADKRRENPTLDVILQFCQNAFCINACANPIIYFLMNPSFKEACMSFLKRGYTKKPVYRLSVSPS